MVPKNQRLWFAVLLFMQMLLVVVAIATPAEAQSPVGWWKFDDGAGGTAADSSGNGHNATLVNGVSWVTGKIGTQCRRTGGISICRIPAVNVSTTKAVTVTMWVNRTYSTAGRHTLLEATSNYNSSPAVFVFFLTIPRAGDQGSGARRCGIHGQLLRSARLRGCRTAWRWFMRRARRGRAR